MFVELMPLLAGRTVMITVARVDDRTWRVNVIPTKTNESENAALTTPLHDEAEFLWTYISVAASGESKARCNSISSLERM